MGMADYMGPGSSEDSGAGSISDTAALAAGWVVTTDATGAKVYQTAEGSVYDTSGQLIANVNRAAVGDSAGFNFATTATDLLKAGLSIYQLNQQQKTFNDVNRTRAAQGLSPLPWSQFAPTASVGVAADPKILWTVGIVGLLLAVGLFGRGRR